MEINDYVRINNNFNIVCIGIGKIIKINQDTVYIDMRNNLPISVNIKDIAKYSEDIINLIEENDIVTICDNFGGHKLETYMIDNNSKENNINILKSIIDKAGYSIEKVLTKEQFEQNCYKIEKER